jgi:hypothetical protein
MFRQDLESHEWERLVDREVWFRLKKVKVSGGLLGERGEARLVQLSKTYRDWKLAPDDSDEFPYWMGEVEGSLSKSPPVPTRRREMVKWLEEHPHSQRWHEEDEWRLRCHDNFVSAVFALIELSINNKWPTDRWREALQTWREDKFRRSWRYLARVIVHAPDHMLLDLKTALSSWIQAHAKKLPGHDDLFFKLTNRVLDLQMNEPLGESDDPVGNAINHSVGQITEALLHWWYGHEPKEGQGLQLDLKRQLSKISNVEIPVYRHGRVILAAHTVALFRVDEQWVKTHLVHLFDWEISEEEARAAWEGFLWSPRLYSPLLSTIKKPMLDAASHYTQLGKHADQFAAFLTFAALNPSETFSSNELAIATRALPTRGLQEAAQTLVRAMEGAGNQRQEYWHNRLLPYFKSIWPKSRDVMNLSISESLARICVAAHEAFPEAFEQLQHWLQPVTYPDFLVSRLAESSLCKQFPVQTLEFLNIIIGNESQWLPPELRQCLDEIKQAKAHLARDRKYIRLDELFRRSGNS